MKDEAVKRLAIGQRGFCEQSNSDIFAKLKSTNAVGPEVNTGSIPGERNV